MIKIAFGIKNRLFEIKEIVIYILKLLITYSLKPLQLSAIRSSELVRLRNLEYQQESKEIDLLVVRKLYMHDRFLSQYLHLREMSNSALRQDVFAAITSGCKS
jgi:hypothetical protein